MYYEKLLVHFTVDLNELILLITVLYYEVYNTFFLYPKIIFLTAITLR